MVCSSGRRDRGAQIQHHSSRYINLCLWFCLFVLRFFCSHLSHEEPQSYFSPSSEISVEAGSIMKPIMKSSTFLLFFFFFFYFHIDFGF